MFENKTFDNLMNEMLADFPVNIRTDEGSLVYNSLAKQAIQLENAYINLSYLYDNLLASTMTLDVLKIFGEERGVYYKEATPAIIKVIFVRSVVNQDITVPIGTQLYYKDLVYTVVEQIDINYYKLECNTAGLEGNIYNVELSMVDFTENFATAYVTEILIAGAAAETEEHYRKRVIDALKVSGFSGNKKAYKDKINEYDGIGGCKVGRRNPESGYIDITIIGSDFNVPSNDLINTIQTDIDPTQDGEGDGWCPMCHKVNIQPVRSFGLEFKFTIDLEDGYEVDDVQNDISKAIETFIYDTNKEWANKDYLTIYITTFETYIKNVLGVKTVINNKTFINDYDTDFMVKAPDVIYSLNKYTMSIVDEVS